MKLRWKRGKDWPNNGEFLRASVPLGDGHRVVIRRGGDSERPDYHLVVDGQHRGNGYRLSEARHTAQGMVNRLAAELVLSGQGGAA